MLKTFLNLPKEERQRLTFVAFAAFFVGALLVGALVELVQTEHPGSKAKALRESDIATTQSKFQFIDPLIGTKGGGNTTKYAEIEKQVVGYIDSEKQKGLISASVNFRDINEASGFTVNPLELYTPASLNKVPVMMAYYKIAEKDPGILSHVLTYTGTKNSADVQEIKSAIQLTPGTGYSVAQLIEHMIRYSDNNATDLLTKHLQDTGNVGTYTAVFGDLGISPSVLSEYTDNVSAQDYSIFLRALYNATYLNRTDSEHALQLLSTTDFTEGIEAGVPNGVPVAEKFGEVRMTDTNGALIGKEINNCGIIYYPEHPYLLCIMTKKQGDDIKALEEIIASISRIVYKGMQKMYP